VSPQPHASSTLCLALPSQLLALGTYQLLEEQQKRVGRCDRPQTQQLAATLPRHMVALLRTPCRCYLCTVDAGATGQVEGRDVDSGEGRPATHAAGAEPPPLSVRLAASEDLPGIFDIKWQPARGSGAAACDADDEGAQQPLLGAALADGTLRVLQPRHVSQRPGRALRCWYAFVDTSSFRDKEVRYRSQVPHGQARRRRHTAADEQHAAGTSPAGAAAESGASGSLEAGAGNGCWIAGGDGSWELRQRAAVQAVEEGMCLSLDWAPSHSEAEGSGVDAGGQQQPQAALVAVSSSAGTLAVVQVGSGTWHSLHTDASRD
jgi:hypothetical protein